MNEREKRFCEEYLVDLCAARAALRAGYPPATANGKAASWIKRENPKKPQLRAEIDRLLAERSLRTRVNSDRVVMELANIAFDSADGARTKDKLRALELLGKHLGMFAGNAREEQPLPVIVDDGEGMTASEE